MLMDPIPGHPMDPWSSQKPYAEYLHLRIGVARNGLARNEALARNEGIHKYPISGAPSAPHPIPHMTPFPRQS